MSNSILRFIFLLLSVFTAMNSWSVTRRALVIGIGTYQDTAWEKIHGDRDIALVVEMLQKLGYEEIVTLVNEQATKSGILAAFEHLQKSCQKGDWVYVHFSGHGQRMTDVDGDEQEDGWDESWIPYDAYLKYGPHDRGEKHLSDDEVGFWMTKVRHAVGKRGQIVVSVDACHSGDSSRELDELPVRGVIQNFIIPDSPQRISARLPESWLTLSACKPFQRNCEILTDSGYYGMLSYALYHLYPHFKGKDNVEVLTLLHQFVNVHRGALPQSPQLTGEKDKYEVVHAFYD